MFVVTALVSTSFYCCVNYIHKKIFYLVAYTWSFLMILLVVSVWTYLYHIPNAFSSPSLKLYWSSHVFCLSVHPSVNWFVYIFNFFSGTLWWMWNSSKITASNIYNFLKYRVDCKLFEIEICIRKGLWESSS